MGRVLFRFWLFLCFLLVGITSLQFSKNTFYKKAIASTCKQVDDSFYLDSDELDQWYKECLNRAEKIPFWWSKATSVRWLQSYLGTFPVSHLDLWTPYEMVRMWEGEAKDLGIKVLQIEDRFFVKEIYPGSNAENQLLVGDEILSINDTKPATTWEIESAEGLFVINRRGERVEKNLKKVNLTFPFGSKLYSLAEDDKVGVLQIRSFAPVYFNEKKWQQILKTMSMYESLVIDLRENTGGDFVVMLKQLSPFFCDSTDIGYLSQPRSQETKESVFTPKMDGSEQIETIKNSKLVELRTFKNPFCFSGEVDVLIDESTASTGEIFAHAMRLRKGTRLMGRLSAGAVLLAIWYPTMFGKNYSISIPVATYKDWKDNEIEGQGIQPDRHLYYKIEDMLQGKDSWLLEAIKG